MSDKTENTRFIMHAALNQIRKAKKHPRLLDIFERAMEAHLEALRVERERDVMVSAELLEQRGVLRDAYECQQMRTHNALCESRRLSDDLFETRRELASVKNDREEGHGKLQEAISKLARASLSLIALHRVIKDQQAAQDRLQRGLNEAVEKINADRLADKTNELEWELAYGELESRNDEKQDLIVSQRKRIDSLESELLLSKKPAQMSSFWLFWMRKSTKAKILPEKTH